MGISPEWNKLSKLPYKKIVNIQDKLVRNLFSKKLAGNEYYNKLYKAEDIKLSKIKSTDDLQKLPTVSKLDFVSDKMDIHYDLLATPQKKFISHSPSEVYDYKPLHIHFTAGRSSKPIPVMYTASDLEVMKLSSSRIMDMCGISSANIAVNAFPYMPHLAFWQAVFGSIGSNVFTLHTGGGKGLGTKRILNSINFLNADILTAMPGYSAYLAQKAKEEKIPLNIKKLILGGERVPERLRLQLKDAYDAKIFSTYGFTEGKTAWCECSETENYHLYPDLEFVELIDPKTEERVSEGESGELVYTSLGWNGSQFIRYRTGDIVDGMFYHKCECGRTVPRLGNSIKRTFDKKELKITKIKGELVDLNYFYDLMYSYSEIKEWQIEIRRNLGRDEVVIHIAVSVKANKRKVRDEIAKSISEDIGIKVKVGVKRIDELREMLGYDSRLKERRIVDMRNR